MHYRHTLKPLLLAAVGLALAGCQPSASPPAPTTTTPTFSMADAAELSESVAAPTGPGVQDGAFLARLGALGLGYPTADAAITEARIACAMTASGSTTDEVGTMIPDWSPSPEFVAVAREVYCPEYR